jgi:hypothetical protein
MAATLSVLCQRWAWIPACAGMTEEAQSGLGGRRGLGYPQSHKFEIPAPESQLGVQRGKAPLRSLLFYPPKIGGQGVEKKKLRVMTSMVGSMSSTG